MSRHITDLKKSAFVEFTGTNDTAVRTVNGLINFSWDYVSLALTSATVETYTFKTGGSSGTTVGTIIITYTDSTKETLLSAERT